MHACFLLGLKGWGMWGLVGKAEGACGVWLARQRGHVGFGQRGRGGMWGLVGEAEGARGFGRRGRGGMWFCLYTCIFA